MPAKTTPLVEVTSATQTLLTGVYRSGTEYLAQVLGCHPEVSSTMYRVNVLRFAWGKYDPISDPAQYSKALADTGARIASRYGLVLDEARIKARLARAGPVSYGTLYDAIMTDLYVDGTRRHWIEKNQLLWREIPVFLDLVPEGRAVLVVRDPRAVLLSFKKYTYAPPPAYLQAVFNCVDAMQHAARYKAELPASRFRVVRYEDVAQDPQRHAEALWAFLGVGDANRVDVRNGTGWKDATGKPWRVNSSFHAADDARPFDVASSIERWRTLLSPEEVALAEGICGAAMAQFAYEPSFPKAAWPDALRLLAHDDGLMHMLRRWLQTGEGIEAFPTDPLDPRNWEENRPTTR